ncbi:MAG: hypothetical protein WD066_17435 [Planctomycetaceae bacterium]
MKAHWNVKQWCVVIAAAGIVVWLLVEEVREYGAIEYYSGEPHLLLYPAAFGVACGIIVWMFTILSARTQHRLKVWGWGMAAGALTVAGGYLATRSVSLAPIIREFPWVEGPLVNVLLASLCPFIGAVYCSYECRRAWKSEPPH